MTADESGWKLMFSAGGLEVSDGPSDEPEEAQSRKPVSMTVQLDPVVEGEDEED